MIPTPAYRDAKVAVFGLGRAGLAAVRALAAGGAEVLADDDDAARRDAAEKAGARATRLAEGDWTGIGALVLSPGVPLDHPKPHPVVKAARAAGIEIMGEVEVLGRSLRPDGGAADPGPKLVGITGTNGKSTATALLGHLLDQAGLNVQVGGNLGTAALDLEPLDESGIYVLEMSSYQLDLTSRVVFDVAALLNITPDHLDRHGGMDGYIAAKRRIFSHQTNACTAVIAVDDKITAAVFDDLTAGGAQQLIAVSAERPIDDGIYVRDGVLVDAMKGGARDVAALSEIETLPGRHNWQNAAVAYAIARALGVESQAAARGLASYPGLAHRQELIGRKSNVRFVNDSKATNVTATAQALGCYDTIYWVAGGRAKDDDLSELEPYFDRVRHAFLIGEASPAFADQLAGRVTVTESGSLDEAVAAAAALAASEGQDGAVVLLSPACASFDQFRDFEARGDAFRAAVEALPDDLATMHGARA